MIDNEDLPIKKPAIQANCWEEAKRYHVRCLKLAYRVYYKIKADVEVNRDTEFRNSDLEWKACREREGCILWFACEPCDSEQIERQRKINEKYDKMLDDAYEDLYRKKGRDIIGPGIGGWNPNDKTCSCCQEAERVYQNCLTRQNNPLNRSQS